MILNPLEQFSIFSIFNIFEKTSLSAYTALSFVNSNFFLLVNILLFLFLVKLLNLNQSSKLIPNRFQYILSSIYKFVLNILVENVGPSAKKYFPWIFVIFVTLFIVNISGMVPFSFTVTSHLIVTFWLGLSIFIGITIIGFATHGIKYFNLFLPAGVPLALAPALVVIELLSYFIRVISLSVRLFANMMSGHILLKVLLGFSWTMMVTNYVLYTMHFIPLGIVFLLIFLEIGVALIQAYVFTILVCIYLNDALNLH